MRRLVLVVLIVASAPGCARGPLARRAGRDESTPTLGADRRAIPPGRVIPPAGLGVDLVGWTGPGRPAGPTRTPRSR